MGNLAMPKRKTTNPKTETEKPPGGRKAIAVVIKGGSDWKTWLEGLADHCRTDVAKVIDQALIKYAKDEGYDAEAPRR
ncbi:MAG: hypothetical protein P4L85_02725 [Paludisphaera borealis]|uniref:hypothetical protein n=1 Tax=Paludisphaera borealis TaxID=1387353 RepID=UPI002842360C|nr:hypothetical protein [Paludisphaera borealis]MDR3618236.1 hypothetical protein [Paludisphaera borealis]